MYDMHNLEPRTRHSWHSETAYRATFKLIDNSIHSNGHNDNNVARATKAAIIESVVQQKKESDQVRTHI